MGVEYRHFLIPRPNTYRPTAAQLHAFIQALEHGNWIAAPGSDAHQRLAVIERSHFGPETTVPWAQERLPNSGGRIRKPATIPHPMTLEWIAARLSGEMKLEFPIPHVQEIGIRYPLVCDSGIPEDAYFTIEIHASNDYINNSSDCIDLVDAKCDCGEELLYWPDDDDDVFFASRIRSQCPSCLKLFDPIACTADFRDGFTGAKFRLAGGAICRFALVIECGKCIPTRKRQPPCVDPVLMELLKNTLGTDFYQVGDFH